MKGQPDDLGRYLLVSMALVMISGAFLLAISNRTLMGIYFATQDMAVCAVMILLFFGCSLVPVSTRLSLRAPSQLQVWLAAGCLVMLLWWGTYAVLFNYPLTRDEHMVVFDAAMFSQGRLFSPLAPEWRDFAVALVPAFLLDVPGHAVLVSNYGPGNAMLRAGFGLVADPALMNPVLAGVGLVALHRVALRLFPEAPGAVTVALLGYVVSAQILVTAMTPYAMTPHLVLNLIWLSLFVTDRRWSHGLAMAIGTWAMGLHQFIFHPLFAGPFILMLLARRRWVLFSAYAAVYAGALLFWISYPTLLMKLAGIAATQGSGAGVSSFVTARILPLFIEPDPAGWIFTIYNFFRFIAWSPAFLLPLALASWPAVRRGEGLALPLCASVVLTLVAMFVVLPYQGHGWGYRYLHPVLGNLILLAGYGYARLARADSGRANAFVLASSALTLLVFLPWLLVAAHQFVKPSAALARQVERQTADFVVIDTETPAGAVDVVRNLPDLSNRPLVFSSKDLTQAALVTLCDRGSIAFMTRHDGGKADLSPLLPESSPLFAWRRSILSGRDCVVPTSD